MPDRIRLLLTPVGSCMTNQPQSLSGALAATTLAQFRQQSPLVHCMTNDVVQNITANVLLALNASPAMVIDAQEAAAFSAVADALLINVGTLTRDRMQSMLAAIDAAREANTPWTLDPVAVGALPLRTEFCHHLLERQPAAIRGNASEILALAEMGVLGRGVDTQHASHRAITAAQQLALRSGAIVAVSGEVDYVTDGERIIAVSGGDVLMTRVVGTGCALSATVAAFCALPGDRLTHVAVACQVMATAGSCAAGCASGPGSFQPAFLDALWQLDAEALV